MTALRGVDPDRCRSTCGTMLRLTSAREGLDDKHASAAAGAWSWQHAWFVGRWGLGCVGLFGAGRHDEQLARPGDAGGAVVVGERDMTPSRLGPIVSAASFQNRPNWLKIQCH
jgi:hypothetical protein